MGMKLSWVAIKEENYSKINHILGLSNMTLLGISKENQYKEYYENDERDGFDGRLEAFATQKGWYFINCRYLPSFIEEKLDLLSIGTTLVMFSLTETAMYSIAEHWCDGQMIWSIKHGDTGDADVFHLEEKGKLPDNLTSIKEEIFAEQNAAGGVNAGVDIIIEIPSLVAKEMTGYKHDEGFTNGDKVIESTESVLSRKKTSLLFTQ